MKRISTGRTPQSSYANRLARLIPQQSAYHAARARSSDKIKIAAAGTQAWLYQRATGGLPCTCGITEYKTVLDDDGNLTPEAMQMVAEERISPDRGLEVYRATDFAGLPDILDPTLIEGETEISDLEEVDLLGLEDIRCAVCFGSGFIPGFVLANGHRVVFAPSMNTESDYEIDQTRRPHVARTGTFVEFEGLLPIRAVLYRIWDEQAVPHHIVPIEQPDPGGQGVFRFEPPDGMSWTHFEMVSVGASIPVDINAQHDEEMSEMEYQEADFNVPGQFRVNLFSVIIENRTGYAWQVRSIIPTKDNQGMVVYQTANARRIRGNELTSLLLAQFTSG